MAMASWKRRGNKRERERVSLIFTLRAIKQKRIFPYRFCIRTLVIA